MSGPLFRKKGSSRWWCRVPNPSGGKHLRRPTGQQDRSAALVVWRDFCRQSVTKTDRNKEETSLADALDRRIAERKSIGRAKGTIESLTKKARQLNRVMGGETPLSLVTARLVDSYVTERRAEDTKLTTIGKELSALRGALKLARRQGYAAPTVDEVMPLDFSLEYKPKTRALSVAEVDALLADLPAKRGAVVAWIVATSATYPTEAEFARKADFDRKRWVVHLHGTKVSTRDRHVPIPRYARRWLEYALDNASGGPEGTLFEPWTNVRRDLHAAAVRLSTCAKCLADGKRRNDETKCKACLRTTTFAKLSPNDLRRTFGRQLRARGIEPQLIAVGMGHKDSRMVERVYGRITPDELGHLLEERLSGAKTKAAKKGRAA